MLLSVIYQKKIARKKKTRNITFSELKVSEYLLENVNTSLSKTIFGLISRTFDVKEHNPWEYNDDLCVKCQEFNERMDHFFQCNSYGDTLNVDGN